ncbi:hypothetical protein DFJ63DRAFT_139375 [Scheffersomyces coipomensis]|uniref:uncharacterized protein n=1 Tax=Scheffersomyces coipomensis TaxID=1788519 RepID=UPI00315DAA9E
MSIIYQKLPNPKDSNRSRGGCMRCKKLKITCDNSKSKCEHCELSINDCVYQSTNFINSQYNRLLDQQQEQLIHTTPTNVIVLNTLVQRYSHQFDTQLRVNNGSGQLGISKFELRLLDFFNNYCIYGFSYEPNDEIHYIWTNKVPSLFMKSQLIRNSICAFSCLNLFPFSDDLNNLRIEDDSSSRLKFNERFHTTTSSNESQQIISSSSNDLLNRITDYFTHTLSGTNQLLENLQNQNAFDKDILANEFIISSIMMFMFLATHHHKIMPLVSFNKSESDFLSICESIRNVIANLDSIIQINVFKQIFLFPINLNVPNLEESVIPIIVRLQLDLESEYDTTNFSSTSLHEYNTLYHALETLQVTIYKAISYGYPIPIYRWVLILSNDYHDLIYDESSFALRLLYVFASLASLTNFQLFKEVNLWVDYMNWYKAYNYRMYGEWKYSMDKSLYLLTFDQEFTLMGNREINLMNFDPDFLVQDL